MAKFCPNCGTRCEDNAVFCAGCGNKLAAPQQPQYQAPQQPHYQAPTTPAPTQPFNLNEFVRKNMKIILIVIAAVGLLVGIMNLFATYDVEVSVKNYGSTDVSLSDVREDPGEYELFVISTYVMGVVGLAVAGLAGYATNLLVKNSAGSRKFFSYAALVCAAGSALSVILALIGGSVEVYGTTATIGTPFIYWISLIVGAAALYIDKGILKENGAPLQ